MEAAALPAEAVLARLGSSPAGLAAAEATRRLASGGPNRVPEHSLRALQVLGRQFANPLLLLLAAAATFSAFTGQHADAAIVLAIVALSVGLGFVNEFRSERAVAALNARIRHRTTVVRDGRAATLDVGDLVPGDVVRLEVGDVVPADLRLLEVAGLECDEAVLTGESVPAEKSAAPYPHPGGSLFLPSCAFAGTVVRGGTATGAVVATGAATAIGRIAVRLRRRPVETAFQAGLRDFSMLLVRVAAVLTAAVFGLNLLLGRPFLEAALFALAIAVGLTPQLLPAIVTVSLSVGAQRLARRSVVVKRLVSIEDFGNVEVLFTDKTGTLTEGRLAFTEAVDTAGRADPAVLRLALACTSSRNPLDDALVAAAGSEGGPTLERLAEIPFDYDRRLMSVVVATPDGGRLLVSKGAPEGVLARSRAAAAGFAELLEQRFDAGERVVAVATRPLAPGEEATSAAEHDLEPAGLLCFSDPPKASALPALALLGRLGVSIRVVTGDNERVAKHVCEALGMPVRGVVRGDDLEGLTDSELAVRLPRTSIFARVTPEQKARIIRVQRALGADVAFLGDGVNDALALHEADVGVSVDSGTDVAKDAADIVLLEKDLGILADGIVEGRRIFANTIKYVLMGTSSNFGNMFSAAGASVLLPFLPMTPTQILLNNLLYDVSEMTIPTDNVDEELLQRPAHWDVAFVRRFMVFFGPISSAFDFATYGVMWWGFHAGAALFQTGWFVESLATQTLVIFVIRTRRQAWRSRPGRALTAASVAVVLAGALLPASPAATLLGMRPLPPVFFAILACLVATYLVLVEVGKRWFFRARPPRPAWPPVRRTHAARALNRRARVR